MASTVAFLAASCCINSGFCAGQMKLISVPPSRSRPTSSLLGPRTLNTMSAPDHRACASGAMVAPAARYASSEKFEASPAPDSTETANPSLISFSTTSGTVATRFSPGKTSRGTPMHWDFLAASLGGELDALVCIKRLLNLMVVMARMSALAPVVTGQGNEPQSLTEFTQVSGRDEADMGQR